MSSSSQPPSSPPPPNPAPVASFADTAIAALQSLKECGPTGTPALVGAAAVAAAGAKFLDSRYQVSDDLVFASRYAPLVVRLFWRVFSSPPYDVVTIWDATVAAYSGKTAIIFEGRRLSFKDLDTLSDQMAHFLVEKGVEKGEVCALVMANCPEFVCWWLAMAKVGILAALVNFNLHGKPLAHALTVSKCRHVVTDLDCLAATIGCGFEGAAPITLYLLPGQRDSVARAGYQTISGEYLMLNPAKYPPSRRPECSAERRKDVKIMDTFGFIYTSGTTGLPKAAAITHARMWLFGQMLGNGANLTSDDIVYTCLPIFHSAGGGIGIGMMLGSGCTVVLAKKFSAKRFWPEVSMWGCTVIQYIGELCRYLVSHAKEHPEVKALPHSVRCAVGNGLRPEVWNDFQDGFNIPLVVEFYGATEGNGGLVNICDRDRTDLRGAVGKMGTLVKRVLGYKIVKFDVATEEPVRHRRTGYCIDCKPGEAGELLMPIKAHMPHTRFEGYTDAKATEKKIIRNAFCKGDAYFRSGDLLRIDSEGRFYFVDRIGDTFRWKGENVSTTEVAEVCSAVEGVAEANVYGVQAPGCEDGRCCMVALQLDTPDLTQLYRAADPPTLARFYKACKEQLPAYALPRFIRVLSPENVTITATFKQTKVQLRSEGCDPDKVTGKGDVLLWLNPRSNTYTSFTPADYQDLASTRARL